MRAWTFSQHSKKDTVFARYDVLKEGVELVIYKHPPEDFNFNQFVCHLFQKGAVTSLLFK